VSVGDQNNAWNIVLLDATSFQGILIFGVTKMNLLLANYQVNFFQLNDYKENNSPEFALHARFDFKTGMQLKLPFLHFQMDLIAFYILVVVQMTTGGAQMYNKKLYMHNTQKMYDTAFIPPTKSLFFKTLSFTLRGCLQITKNKFFYLFSFF
jgi:hypothetical protein